MKYTSALLKQMKWLKFKERSNNKLLYITYITIYKNTPSYIASHPTKDTIYRTIRSINELHFKIPDF